MTLSNPHFTIATRQVRLKLAVYLLLAFALMLLLPGIIQADVSVKLSRHTIHAGDTVILQITTSGNDKTTRPDLEPLRQHFEIIGTSSSTQIQIINGQRTDKQIWNIELSPLTKGSLKIPSLTIGNNRTDALPLEVKDQVTANDAQAGQDILVRTEVSPKQSTYVQQQVLYTIRLYFKVPLIEGSFTDPKIDNAVVERLGEDSQYKTTLDGHQYQVIERRYAVFPERSGPLVFKPIIFSGKSVAASDPYSSSGHMNSMIEQMLKQRGFNDSFFGNSPFGDPGKRVRVRSKEVTLNIKPRPDSYSGQHWLPTEKLTLKDDWENTLPIIHAGEPVTRTITLEAKGLEASQLPELKKPQSDTLHIYSEQAKLTNRTDGNWIFGRNEQRLTYVASKTGHIHIPAIQVTWWDPVKHTQREAILPARDLTVLPGKNTQAPYTGNQVNNNASVVNKISQAPQDTTKKSPANSGEQLTDDYRQYWMPLAGLLILIMSATYLLWRRRTPSGPASTRHAREPMPEFDRAGANNTLANQQQIAASLRTACEQSNPQLAAQALLEWARCTWPVNPPRSLGALVQKTDKHAQTLKELESVLYSANRQEWQGKKLWNAFNDGLLQSSDKSNSRSDASKTPPLYPDWKKYGN